MRPHPEAGHLASFGLLDSEGPGAKLVTARRTSASAIALLASDPAHRPLGVANLLLQAMAPAALEVSLAAARQAEAHPRAADRIWRQRLERAEIAADRARRQYQLAEPENRLVVRQLEKDWETALAEREKLGEEYDRFNAARPYTLTASERARIRALATDVPGIWHAPTTTSADRKRLIRHLVEQVRVTVAGTSEKVDVEVVWAGGHRTNAQIVRPVACLTQLSYYPQLAARARELADAGHTTVQIAERLNAEGFRPPNAARHSPRTPPVTCCGPWASSTPVPRPTATARPWPSTNGGSVTSLNIWTCPTSPSTPGSARLGQRLPPPPGPATGGARGSRRDRTATRPAPGATRPAQPAFMVASPGRRPTFSRIKVPSTTGSSPGRAQHRISQLEQCVPVADETPVQLAAERRQQPARPLTHHSRPRPEPQATPY
jgi:hypothetical protein